MKVAIHVHAEMGNPNIYLDHLPLKFIIPTLELTNPGLKLDIQRGTAIIQRVNFRKRVTTQEPLFFYRAPKEAPRPKWKVQRQVVLGQLTTRDNSPPDINKAQLLPTRTTIPRTTPH